MPIVHCGACHPNCSLPIVKDVIMLLNHGSNCRSLCKGMDIWQLVSACQIGSSPGDPISCEEAKVPTMISCISVCMRSTFALFASSIHALTDFILNFPLRMLGLALCRDLLDFGDHWWTMGGIMPQLITVKSCNWSRVA